MLDCRDIDQGSDGMFENGTVPTIYDNTDGEGDEKYNKTSRLVPAQADGYFRSYAGFDAGVCDEVEDERNGEQSQTQNKSDGGFWWERIGHAGAQSTENANVCRGKCTKEQSAHNAIQSSLGGQRQSTRRDVVTYRFEET